jgi:ABC-type nitrate/sulfonate/bicarbonate transport system substrate-binding protein
MSTRRSFLGSSARLLGGAILIGPPLLSACGSDEKSSSTSSAGTAAATTASSASPGSTPATAGTVRTAFNWVPDVEWAAWYLADSNGLFVKQGVTTPLVHGGPNTPAVAQVLAAGDADVGVASDELQLIQANREGTDFVILGAMYQRSPNGFCWLSKTSINGVNDLVGKKLGLTTGDEPRVDAVFKINGLQPDYQTVQMSYDPQPLIDGEADAITCYVTNQPIQLQLRGIDAKSAPYSDFGLKAYGDVLFASKKFVAANRDLLVHYLAGLLAGVQANIADPKAVLPLLKDKYGKDADVDLAYSEAGNPPYIALYDSDYTRANGRLMIDPAYLQNEVYAGYQAAGETDLPPVSELLDASLMADAHKLS